VSESIRISWHYEVNTVASVGCYRISRNADLLRVVAEISGYLPRCSAMQGLEEVATAFGLLKSGRALLAKEMRVALSHVSSDIWH